MFDRRATVLVTGGGSGLGAACVERLLAEGLERVVVADLNLDRASSWTESHGDRVVLQRVDVTSADDVSSALDAVPDGFPLRGVVHCAGILPAARLVGRSGPHDLDLFRRSIEINLTGTFNVMRLAAAAMMEQEATAEGQRGVIVTTSSVAAFEGQVGQLAYSAAKGAVASMTLPAARELGRWGIRVVSIAPGVFMTPMMEGAPPAVLESLEAQTVFPHRLGQPPEFAAMVWHIFENPMLNGTVLRLDGAMRMGAK